MPIRFFNSLIKEKETFKPLEAGRVKIYICGITPYDYSHIGHARSGIVFDLIRRYLIYKGYNVKFVTNFTDIDDKIIKRANEIGEDAFELSRRFINIYLEEFKLLNVMKADAYPKVTEHIHDIIELIKKLEKKGYAYKTEDGVYFEVKKFKDYGKLSGQSLENVISGARVDVDEKKKHPEDFALWKLSKQNEPFWKSPWGKGRPGWHIECSAMSIKYLGETLDIHGGGSDLIFPHHENEIAQSEAATDKKFVNYWLHNGMITVEGEKMSKSLKNFITIKEALEKYQPMELRYLLLSAQYRSQLNFTDESMNAAQKTLESLYGFVRRLKEMKGGEYNKELSEKAGGMKNKFEDAMDDDLNSPLALSAIFDFIHEVNRAIDENKIGEKNAKEIYELFLKLDTVLGLRMKEGAEAEKIPEEIKILIEKRESLRKEKKFREADAIRDEISKKGWILEDRDGGVRVKRK